MHESMGNDMTIREQHAALKAKAIETFEASTTTRISDNMIPLVARSMARHANGDQVSWDAAIQLLPDAQGSLLGALAVYAQIPGILPTSYIGTGILLQPLADEKVIEQEVRALLESLRDGRTKQLASMQQAGDQAAKTGRGAPHSGLILP